MSHSKRTALIAAAVAGLATAGAANAQKADTLYLFNWSQYMDPAIIEAFEKAHDVEVVENYFNSNGEMFAKLRAGGSSQYDVVVPSNYFIPRLIETGLLQPLDHEQIPNIDNLMPKFRDPSYDPGNEYTVAYQWGTTGIVYNKETLGEAPDSWSVLFDPELNGEQPFALQTDGQVVFGAACAYLGHGYDCTGRDELKSAAKLVLDTKRRDNFSGFIQGTPVLQQIARGSVHAGMTYNGDYIFYKTEDPEAYENIEFMLPEEGTELWVDNMVIPKDAPHPELAHEFINFMLNAEMGAKLSNYTYYSSPNAAALEKLDPILQEPPITPTPEQMDTLAFTPSLKGDDLKFSQQLWTEVQSR